MKNRFQFKILKLSRVPPKVMLTNFSSTMIHITRVIYQKIFCKKIFLYSILMTIIFFIKNKIIVVKL